MSSPSAIVAILREAATAYYNGSGPGSIAAPTMSDDTYDALVDRLRELDPTHPYLEEVGAPPPTVGAVTLPFAMPSLDKIKPGEDRLTRFLASPSGSEKGFVLSEKLDGLSALWQPATKKLYLRGDGLVGQDISHLVDLGLKGLIQVGGKAVAVRGEIILPRAAGEPLARAWVNGVIHRKEPAAEDVAKMRFVGYEVMSPPGLTREAQFAWMTKARYEVPWWRAVALPTESILAEALQSRRIVSPYDTDGIVVGVNAVPQQESTTAKARNPKDCVAFKMPLADQSAETTIREVIWAASAQGYLIPRLRFDPVRIGAATIEFCTGHNARTIVEGGLGPGARVVIRRSGDVIPTLDRVLIAASGGPSLPPVGAEEGGATWEWNCVGGATEATAVHIRATGAETDEMVATRLHAFLKTMEIPGAGPSTATSLIAGGIRGPRALWEATSARLVELLGPKTGAALHANLRTAFTKATELQLMVASSRMPRGVGETKLTTLFGVEADPRRWVGGGMTPPAGWTGSNTSDLAARLPSGWTGSNTSDLAARLLTTLFGIEADPRRWTSALAARLPSGWTGSNTSALAARLPSGWTAASLTAFLAEFPKYEAWRAAELPFIDYPILGRGALRAEPVAATGDRQVICMTGFRDKDLETSTAAQGHTFVGAVTGKTTILLVPDGEVRESEKVKAARAKGLRIMSRSAFVSQYLGGS